MKRNELVKMVTECILESGYLTLEDSENLAGLIVKQIGNKLMVKKQLIVSGSIDEGPEYSIHGMDEDTTGLLNKAEDDPDGFNSDDLLQTIELKLLED